MIPLHQRVTTVSTDKPKLLQAQSGDTTNNTSEQGAQPPTDPPESTLEKAKEQSKANKAVKIALKRFHLFFSTDGRAYGIDKSRSNSTAFNVDSQAFRSALRKLAYVQDASLLLTDDDLKEAISHLKALADIHRVEEPAWLRVAKVNNGIELDLGDERKIRVRVSKDQVVVKEQGSGTAFFRSPTMQPMVIPAEKGNLSLLLPYINLVEVDQWLLIAWITYTLAHAKVPTTSYVILVLRGDRGTGKSTLCNLVLSSLLDPSVVGVQSFPRSTNDLAIAAQNNHVLFYDNLRKLTTVESDALCILSTSGHTATRMLFTDEQESIKRMHCACVLNGIHAFISEPDLAQRCLFLNLQAIQAGARTTETALQGKFMSDLPAILRGILDLMARILQILPGAQPLHGERMLDFMIWLAAMEEVQGLEKGYLQRRYSESLTGAMQDALDDDPLATTVIRFAKDKLSWSDTPTKLLQGLGALAGPEVSNARDWPTNPTSLSLRLKALKSQLSGAGVDIQLGKRSKERVITVRYTGRSA